MNWKREIYRLAPFLIIAFAILWPDKSNTVIVYSTGIVLFLAVMSHIIRKALFPYIDLELYTKKALEEPLSASIVVAAICYILSVVLQSSTLLLR